MILRYLQMNLHQMRNTAMFMTKKHIFWLQTAEKVNKTHLNPTRNIKKSTSPVKKPTPPVRENISPVRELSLSPVREDHSPVRVTSKAGKKQQGESNDQEKWKNIRPSAEIFNQYVSLTDGYDSEFERESQSVQSLNFDNVKKIDNHWRWAPLCMKKQLTLSAVISLLESPKPLQRK